MYRQPKIYRFHNVKDYNELLYESYKSESYCLVMPYIWKKPQCSVSVGHNG